MHTAVIETNTAISTHQSRDLYVMLSVIDYCVMQ